MSENEYGLVPVIDSSTGKYVLEHYDEVVDACKAFIAQNDFDSIADELDFKDLKAARTEIRSKLDQISRTRIDLNEMLLGEFNTQLKTLEALLKDADNKLKGLKDSWEKEHKNTVDKPTVIKITIKSYDAKVINKLKEQALKLGCEVEVK